MRFRLPETLVNYSRTLGSMAILCLGISQCNSPVNPIEENLNTDQKPASYAIGRSAVLFEILTTSNCPSCSNASTNLDNLVHKYGDKVAILSYPGDCTNERCKYYGMVCGNWFIFPYVACNGIEISPSEANLENQYTAQMNIIPSITISGKLTAGQIQVTVKNQSGNSVSGTLHIALTICEDNGEYKEYICKRMFPNESGYAITLAAGASIERSHTFTAASYDLSKMKLVAFVQNEAQKTVYNAFTASLSTEVNFINFSGDNSIRQKSSNYRYLDAYVSSDNDFKAVTRPAQNDNTQKWNFTQYGTGHDGLVVINQKNSGRFLDAHETSSNNYAVVTRDEQNDDSQKWLLREVPSGYFTIQQLVGGRYLDAYTTTGDDYQAVTRPKQDDDTQLWKLIALSGTGMYALKQKCNERFLGAYTSSNDYEAVTSETVGVNQVWVVTYVGKVFRVSQKSSERFLDAYTSSDDYAGVTRTAQNDDTQLWICKYLGFGEYNLQQLSSRRYLQAYESSNDYLSVTRIQSTSTSQVWKILPY